MKDFLEIFVRKRISNLNKKIKIAHLDTTAHEFIKKAVLFALITAVSIGILTFLFTDKVRVKASIGENLLTTFMVLLLTWIFVFWFVLHSLDVQILKRRKEIDQEVLFVGRYLLIKMQSGNPFFNSLIDASKTFGIAGKFLKEIIDEVNTGTPIEDALENAANYCPSKRFSMILREMNNALKLGVDVSKTLELILEDVAEEQLEEIRAFGKKINALSMFYMIIAVVMPSLGIIIMIIASSFIGLKISLTHLFTVVFLLIFLQFMFLALFKSIRPTVNI